MDIDAEIMKLFETLKKVGLEYEATYVLMLIVFRKTPTGMRDITNALFKTLLDAHMKANPELTKKILDQTVAMANGTEIKQ